MNAEEQKRFEELLSEAARQYNIAHEKFTEKQFAEAIRQACACGDFQRHVCPSNSSQCVVYIPHAREAYLINKVRELEEQLRLAKIRCTVCGEYFPGHATGGSDICTCV